MTPGEIKRTVSLETIFRHYGSLPVAGGRWQCLFRKRHRNGDQNPSVTIQEGRATCWSQGCFQRADHFAIVQRVEGLETFEEQRRRVLEIGG